MAKYSNISSLCCGFTEAICSRSLGLAPEVWLRKHQDLYLFVIELQEAYQIELNAVISALPATIRQISRDPRVVSTPNVDLHQRILKSLPSLNAFSDQLVANISEINSLLENASTTYRSIHVSQGSSLKTLLDARHRQAAHPLYKKVSKLCREISALELKELAAIIQAIQMTPAELGDLIVTLVEGEAIAIQEWMQDLALLNSGATDLANQLTSRYHELNTALVRQELEKSRRARRAFLLEQALKATIAVMAALLIVSGVFSGYAIVKHHMPILETVVAAVFCMVTGFGLLTASFPPSRPVILWSISLSVVVIFFHPYVHLDLLWFQLISPW